MRIISILFARVTPLRRLIDLLACQIDPFIPIDVSLQSKPPPLPVSRLSLTITVVLSPFNVTSPSVNSIFATPRSHSGFC